MTITSTAPVLTADGITAPSYAEILEFFTEAYRTIFGADVYLDADSQDGQMLAIYSAAVHDANNVAIAVYNSFSPASAQGVGLSSNVKLNGMERHVPTNSTAQVYIVGTAGVTISNGVVQDAAKFNWALPASVLVPISGDITVTATCATAGAVQAVTGSISSIITPQLGWVSASNTSAATPGAPVEDDATLRVRQTVSVAPAAQTPLAVVIGAVAGVTGVTRYTGYENPLGAPDANGLPAHSLAIVVEGGAPADIAEAIANRKTVGAETFGTTTETVTNSYGVPEDINFFILDEQRISVAIDLRPVNGYTATIGVEVQQAIADYLNALAIGATIVYSRLYNPANLYGAANGQTYEIVSLAVSIFPDVPGTVDVPIDFNAAASCDIADVAITLVA